MLYFYVRSSFVPALHARYLWGEAHSDTPIFKRSKFHSTVVNVSNKFRPFDIPISHYSDSTHFITASDPRVNDCSCSKQRLLLTETTLQQLPLILAAAKTTTTTTMMMMMAMVMIVVLPFDCFLPFHLWGCES